MQEKLMARHATVVDSFEKKQRRYLLEAMTPMSSVRSIWGSRPCQDPCLEEMWLNYSCHCIFRPSAEQALQLLHGTFFGGQNVSLSWGRSPLNKQTQVNSCVPNFYHVLNCIYTSGKVGNI
ncbi:unnamed protein product [Triticum turgidum subsp. durum]|uniref:Uncharacterized protein n=1 Tax=Triticum turgidum subsp. durum TaxID=4567 RepID=A0A9R0X6G6_TRITD|nr:unnamed protein product [Triticum turgidum subsp. durum]